MADQQTSDAAAKKRIIDHMNVDHHDSIICYLQHYHRLSSVSAYTGRIADISLSELTLVCSGHVYPVAFEPPMKAYREARERLVGMDKTCREALGFSDVTVRRHLAPTGWVLWISVLTAAIIVIFSSRRNLETSLAHMLLPEWFRLFCWHVQPVVFWGIMSIHSVETVMFARGRLARHGVNPRSILYWQWLADVMVVGFGAFQRFDRLVNRLQAEKQARKH